jgi:hypothetical protein
MSDVAAQPPTEDAPAAPAESAIVATATVAPGTPTIGVDPAGIHPDPTGGFYKVVVAEDGSWHKITVDEQGNELARVDPTPPTAEAMENPTVVETVPAEAPPAEPAAPEVAQ